MNGETPDGTNFFSWVACILAVCMAAAGLVRAIENQMPPREAAGAEGSRPVTHLTKEDKQDERGWDLLTTLVVVMPF